MRLSSLRRPRQPRLCKVCVINGAALQALERRGDGHIYQVNVLESETKAPQHLAKNVTTKAVWITGDRMPTQSIDCQFVPRRQDWRRSPPDRHRRSHRQQNSPCRRQ